MTTMSLNKAIQQVEQFIPKIKDETTPEGNPLKEAPKVWFGGGELGAVMLWGDTADEYRHCLKSLFEVVSKNEQFSLRAVEELFQMAILKALDINEQHPETSFEQRLSETLENLRKALQTPPDLWELHFRVCGLAPVGLPLTIGCVEFYVADKEHLNTLLNKTNTIFDSTTSKPEEIQSAKDYVAQRLAKYMEGHVVARVEVKAVDEVAARPLAIRELRSTLDVVNFYSDLLHPRGTRAYAYLPGENENVVDVSIAFQKGTNPRSVLNEAVKGPLVPLSWNSKNAKKAESHGFARITEILASRQRSKLDERILSAFQWAGRATVDERREEAFLLYVIALESLLLGPNKNGELIYRLSLRCATLLGLNPEGKQKISKQMRDLYTVRSRIVHSGSIQVTDADLRLIWFYAKNALVAVLTEPHFLTMKNEDEFEQWFENKLLGG